MNRGYFAALFTTFTLGLLLGDGQIRLAITALVIGVGIIAVGILADEWGDDADR